MPKRFGPGKLEFATALFALVLTTRLVVGEDTPSVPDFPRTPPLEPAAAEQSFQVLHGFAMQLIASEPLIADPVDVAYDEDGRGYVVEMRDYPFPEEKGAAPTEFIGQVTLIEDTDDDGVFDRSHVFADKLAWPTSVACWKGGVFVTAAPDIWYFKDTDGDHRADIRERVYTGFTRDNVQAIVNGLRWGLDNCIYGAASGNGGRVAPVGSSLQPVVVTRHDFRFEPGSRGFDAIPGGARFGNAFDDWGNRFVCNIRNPVQHVVLPEREILHTPLLNLPNPIHDAAEAGDQLPVFRISPPERWRMFRAQRWAAERVNFPRSELIGAGYWTSSSGVTIYRGGAYPPEFHGNAFVGEVAGNLVHRQILAPAGVTFTSRRADENAEFVASRDPWFRPVNFVNAPDGTLHVLDMYRETIEHPWSIPDDIKAKLDLRSGNNRGRIYRLAPPGFQVPQQPRLGRLPSKQLVAYLESPHAWWRETAQRLIIERYDTSVEAELRNLLARTPSPQARLHTLYTLWGLNPLDVVDLRRASRDPSPHVRRHAVALGGSSFVTAPELKNELLRLAEDEDAHVRFEVALQMDMLLSAEMAQPLARLAIRDVDDIWNRTAVLAAASGDALPVLKAIVETEGIEQKPSVAVMIGELARFVAAGDNQEPARQATQLRQAAELLNQIPPAARGLSFAMLSGLGAGLQHRRQNLSLLTEGETTTANRVRDLLSQVATVAQDEQATVEQRLPAIDLLRFTAADESLDILGPLLSARESTAVQQAALRVIQSYQNRAAAEVLIRQWRSTSASTAQQIVDALLARPTWTEPLVAALEKDAIRPGSLTIPQRARMVGLANAELRERSIRLLGPAATTERSKIVQEYQAALKLAGDPVRGDQVYRRECMTCHRLGNTGHDVGPNLNTIKHRSPQEILVHVFDPNREIAPQFISYSIALRDGRVLSGIILNDAGAALELQRAENVRETIPRPEIDEIASSGKSLMPEGLEQKINQQDAADLISFLLKPEEWKANH